MNNFFPFHNRPQIKKLTLNVEQSSTANTQLLYEEVIRKNHDVMRTLLLKMSEVYNRQDECEQAISNINEKIQELASNNQNIHHELRTNHIEIEKKTQVLINDVKAVKNVLKIPDPSKSYEDYLSSGFFKEQTSMLNNRSRTRTKRNKTNFFCQKEATIADDDKSKRQKGHRTVQCDYRPQRSAVNFEIRAPEKEVQIQRSKVSFKDLSVAPDEDNAKPIQQKMVSNSNSVEQVKTLIKDQVKQVRKQFQDELNSFKAEGTVRKIETQSKFTELKNKIEQQMQKLSKELSSKNKWNQIDLDQLQKHLENKIKDTLNDKVNKFFFEESLKNLREACEQELDKVYDIVTSKVNREELTPLQEKITELTAQFQSWTYLNSLKIHNISYNSTCKSTPFRINLERSSIGDHQSNEKIARQSVDSRVSKRNNLKFSNSASVLNRFEDSRVQKSGPWATTGEDHFKKIEQMTELQWKQKAAETLGLPCKKVRRQRRS